jgi:succinate dehydrogenase/fumarate reductase flavoprotein subunit
MAAIEASEIGARVILAVDGKVGRSGCTPLGGGPGGADFMVDSASISTVLGLDDLGPQPPDMRDTSLLFKEDILSEGENINNQRMVDVYVSEAPRRMKRLMDLGLRISSIDFAHGSRFPRGVIALNRDIASTMIRGIVSSEVKVLEDTRIVNLLMAEGRCGGGAGVDTMSGGLVGVEARATVIATGGWQMAYHSGGSDELTGDGQAMAVRAGAELVDMEFGTFMDRYLVWPPMGSRDNFIWDWRASRGLVNSEGDEVVPGEEGGLIGSSRRVSEEVSEGRAGVHGGVYLQNPEECIGDGYVKMGSLLQDWDHSGTSFEVAVGFHYCNGGVKVNERTETTVPGLYAAGEASGGLFGARRVASALSEAMVQGGLAGENAADYAGGQPTLRSGKAFLGGIRDRLLAPLGKDGGVGPSELRRNVRRVTSRHLSLHRDGLGLREAVGELGRMRVDVLSGVGVSGTESRRFNREWMDCLSLESLLICVEASARAALMREESRGFHRRVDHPLRDDERWLRNLVVRMERGGLELTAVPVVSSTPGRG